ncbi:MAG: MoaD/ThiS family protein [bacterium]|nr:MoaD/ThiS family protein [bacterium]
MMKIRVLAFGEVAQIIEKHNWEMPLVSSVGALKSQLNNDYPALQEIDYVISVNKKICGNDTLLSDGFELALLPPFSGG